MEPRHGAALALIGWYLMVPPYAANVYRCDKNAPLSNWLKFKSFQSEPACREYLDMMRSSKGFSRDSPTYYRTLYSKCISSDDPGFKQIRPLQRPN